MAANFGFSFDVIATGTTTETDKPKPKADRYRVTTKNYYLGNGPVPVSHAAQCVRCNEILGARITNLYSNGKTFSLAYSTRFNKLAPMGVFCAVTALERGETIPAESVLTMRTVDGPVDVEDSEGEEG